MSMRLYLSLGTNLGDKEHNLRRALELIEQRVGQVRACSTLIATEPWGFQSAHSFLNGACCVETSLTPLQALEETQAIERAMGRTRKSTDGIYHDRLIDIDLLLAFDADGRPIEVDLPQLKLPHPLMQERDFVMRPLREIL